MSHEEKERSGEEPIAATADLPRSLDPARDLWPDIERTIRARPRSRNVIVARLDVWRRPLLAAAVVAIVFLAGWEIGRRSAPIGSGEEPVAVPSSIANGSPGAGRAPGNPTMGPRVASTNDTDVVLAMLAHRRDELDPATVDVLRRNLEVIDRAVTEIREALARDPGNTKLQQMLSEEERRRGSVLHRAADLLQQI